MLCSQLFQFFTDVRVLYCSSLFVTVRHCSSLSVTVRYCSEQFRTVFFLNFDAILHLLKKKYKVLLFCVLSCSSSVFLFRTSCDRDDEKLPLKYIVERTQFYVSLKLEKKYSDELFGGKNYPIEIHGRANSCDRGIRLYMCDTSV